MHDICMMIAYSYLQPTIAILSFMTSEIGFKIRSRAYEGGFSSIFLLISFLKCSLPSGRYIFREDSIL